jgi:hypothetical protein
MARGECEHKERRKENIFFSERDFKREQERGKRVERAGKSAPDKKGPDNHSESDTSREPSNKNEGKNMTQFESRGAVLQRKNRPNAVVNVMDKKGP